jgi:hypothetical protein
MATLDVRWRCALEIVEKVKSKILQSPPGLGTLKPNLSRQLSIH